MAAGTKPEASLRRSPGEESHEEALDDLGEKRKKTKDYRQPDQRGNYSKGDIGESSAGRHTIWNAYGFPRAPKHYHELSRTAVGASDML